MLSLTQLSLFDDTQNENLGDLERLQRVITYMPDEKLIRKLEGIRGKGRNEWPVSAMWNSFIASFIFDHDSIASLLRELNRNSQLRTVCGFQPHFHAGKDGAAKLILAPTPSAYTNFINNLRECGEELREIFDGLVAYMYENLEDFGEILMVDGKAIQSFATKPSEKASGRKGEHDADWCRKTYTTTTPTGEVNTKTVKWFGFRLHLIADAKYELPVDFTVTKASNSEVKEAEGLLEEMEESHPERIKTCEYFLADRGYDSTDLIKWLETKGIAPIIDIRNMWQGEETTKQLRDTDLVYSYDGKVYYVDEKGETIELIYKGYDKSRNSSRYGFHPKYQDKRIFRIPLETDERIFTRVARNSKKWKRLYAMRSGIERVNGRIDRDYKFEKHTIRGLEKMEMFLTVTFLVGLTLAKAKIEAGQTEGLARLYA